MELLPLLPLTKLDATVVDDMMMLSNMSVKEGRTYLEN